MNLALIVFAGKGTRITSSIPKQFIRIKGHEIVSYTINTFQKHPLIDEIVLVTSSDYFVYTQNMVNEHRFTKVTKVLVGGETRQESVRLGLESLSINDYDNVLIHDGDRPLVGDEIITSCLRGLNKHDALTVAIKSEDALKEVHNLGRKYIEDGIEYDIQTPQCFKYGLILEAHIRLKDMSFNDDASMVLEIGKEVTLIEGSPMNFKVTTNMDLEYLKKVIPNYE